MKNLIDKIKENWKQEKIDKRRKELNIEIIPEGKWLNSRFDYAEAGIHGEEEIIKSQRFGALYGTFPVFVGAFPKGSAYVVTGKETSFTSNRELIIKSGGNPENGMQLIEVSPGKKIEYDAVIRFVGENPAEHMYFLNREYLFTREFTPSMGGGKPKDYVEYYKTKHGVNFWRDVLFVKGIATYNKLEIAKPLIEEMEEEIGRIIVDKKYYDSLSEEQDQKIIGNAYKVFNRESL